MLSFRRLAKVERRGQNAEHGTKKDYVGRTGFFLATSVHRCEFNGRHR